MSYRYQLIRLSDQGLTDSHFVDLEGTAKLCDMHPEMIEEFLRGHLVRAYEAHDGAIYFDQAGIARLRQIFHLRYREKMSLRLVREIASLLDLVDTQERELRTLRERLR